MTPEASSPRTKGHRLVIVDDEHGDASNLARFLAGSGFAEPVVVADGRALINYLRKPDEPVDLVLLDIIMPVLDGFAAFWEMKQAPSMPPVVFLSVENSAAVAKYLLEHGAADYITKPYNRGKLLERLQRVLQKPQ